MINDTIEQLEKRIACANSLPEQTRAELGTLLGVLKGEISKLPPSQGEHAESIARFMEASTHEATRRTTDRSLLDLALKGLSQSVKDFETTHPQLAETVNRFCSMLSAIGI